MEEWISVKDEPLPTDGKPFDCWRQEYFSYHWEQDGTRSKHGETRKACRITDLYYIKHGYHIMSKDGKCKAGFTNCENWLFSEDEIENITHWKPLPKPPTD